MKFARSWGRIRSLLQGEGLGGQTARGSAWLMAGRIVTQGSAFLRLAIVARYLSPSEFGIMGIVLIVLAVVESFTNPGLDQALIQRQGPIAHLMPSVFCFKVARSIALGIMVVALATPVAHFFDEPVAVDVIRASAVILVLRGLQSPAIAEVHRSLRYKSYFFWELSSTVIALLAALGALAFTHSVWVLLVSYVIEELARSVGSYILAPWSMQLTISWSTIRELSVFGRWVTAGLIISFVSLQLDSMVVGRLISAGALGIYQMAMRISQLPATQIGQVGAVISFSVLSSVSDQEDRFRQTYLKLFTSLLVVNLVVSVGLITLAEPAVMLILGDSWSDTIPVIQVLAIGGFFRSMILSSGRVFFALGVPKYETIMNLVTVIVTLLAIYPMVSTWGLKGAAATMVLSLISAVPTYFILLKKCSGISLQDHVAIGYNAIHSHIGNHKEG